MKKEFLNRRIFLSFFIFWQVLFLFIPLGIILYKGIFNVNFLKNLIWIFNSNFLKITFRSFSISFFVSIISLLIGYLISYIIIQKSFFLEIFYYF